MKEDFHFKKTEKKEGSGNKISIQSSTDPDPSFYTIKEAPVKTRAATTTIYAYEENSGFRSFLIKLPVSS